MSYEHILVEQRDRVGVITMNHPERLNAWSGAMEHEMRAAALALDADESVGAIIFTGAGRGYCAGADISAFTAGIAAREAAQATGGGVSAGESTLGEWTRFILALAKPTIAAVNGVAVGMGLTSMLPMDIRIASDQARFGAVFAKMGVVPELGGSYFLPQLIGMGRAIEWCLSARLVPAAEAWEAGLVTAVVPHEDLIGAAVEKAAAIAAHPAPHLTFAKRLIRANASNPDLDAVIRSENDALAQATATWEHTEAIRAFMEKRAPDYATKPAAAH